MRAKPVLIRVILLVAGVVLGSVSAPVWAQGYLGVSAGLYQPEDGGQDRTETFDVRGGYRIRPQFGFEWSLSRVKLTDIVPFTDDPSLPGFDFDELNLRTNLTNLDLSLQWFPKGGNFVVFGGPGVALLDAEIEVLFLGERFTDSDNNNIFTAHAGIAYVWPVTKRFFVRPEARVRRYFGYDITEPDPVEVFYYSYKATDYQAGVTFGLRFGS
jgi:hypothetical protein